MTKEQKIEAYAMLLDGATYREVAKRFGVPPQTIHSVLPGCSSRSICNKKLLYPSIGRFLAENKMSITDFSKKIGVPYSTARKNLRSGGNFGKETIDKILSVTGLTYEEAFSTEQAESPDGR